jgi:putative ABC transport system ATP-binding protein
MDALDMRGVKKALGEKRVLRGVDLEVRKGEIMALVGPSGSGKSTLLRCVNRLIEVDGGKIYFGGEEIRALPPADLRRRAVLVPQEAVMLEGTVRDNVAYGPAMMGGTLDEKGVVKCLEDSGLGRRYLEKDAGKLSGGEKRRVALARALALEPEVLLLDEPTAGVDPKRMETMERAIVDMVRDRGLTVLWVTHDVPQALRVGQRIANLKGGVVKQVSTSDKFRWEGAY